MGSKPTKKPGAAGAPTPSADSRAQGLLARVSAPAKVYVLEAGCYEESRIVGVFATREAAMEAWKPKPQSHNRVRGYGKLASYEWSEWRFDADWDDAAKITEYEVRPESA